MLKFIEESHDLKARINEKEFSIHSLETTPSREKSLHFDEQLDDQKGDIVRLTIRTT